MAAEPAPETSAPDAPVVPDALPVLPLRDAVVLPLAAAPLAVAQERSLKLIDDVMRANRLLALVPQRDPAAESPGPDALYGVATMGVIHQLARAADGSVRLLVQGVERIRITGWVGTEPYLVARVQPAPDRVDEGTELDGLRRAAVDLFRKLVPLVGELPAELALAAEGLPARQIAYLIAAVTPLETAVRQEILELDPVSAKLRRLVDLLQRELAVRELGRKITTQTEERLTKRQREAYLREQLQSIRRELGEEDEGGGAQDLERRIEEARLPGEAEREARRELERLKSVPAASPEHGLITTYLEWLASLPWHKTDGGPIDVREAQRVLDEDHFDLEKVKDRIVEHLAVKKLRAERAGGTDDASGAHEPILCLVGPPGVGKTSLGQSIARALGRKFARMSLGGVRDEAEVRGHRRTYVGALPGRIIQGLRRAESRDPVFMLDEIDKVGSDWRGDPSSALLEVLDPAQNHAFVDHYLGVPFDLSQVLFIATANTLDTIPGPLRDRMEVLALSGYTDEEKLGIATRYLVPKQLRAHGLGPDELAIDADALRLVVRAYTREAGVRSLEREIGTIARKVARRAAEGQRAPFRVAAGDVAGYLGRPRFFDEAAERTTLPGVATGLAWTPSGGDVLFVEATMMPTDEERLVLTGMLGDVMRESAQAAVSYIRSMARPPGADRRPSAAREEGPHTDALDVDPQVFEGKTIHIHVPAGAIPKDGPSAGVTIATALASLVTRRPVRGDLAMTGEITLRGKVLPVGGIKEKVLAAHRSGIRTVILPRRNERDVEDVPEEVRRDLRFVFADAADDVLREALTPADSAVSGTPR